MKQNLTTDWLIGFIDGDGYFGLEKTLRKRHEKIDVFYRPILAISQKDVTVLYKIKSVIGCGTVSSKGKDKTHHHYRIRSAAQFKEFFLPMIQHRKFQTNKQLQLELLQEAVNFLTTDYSPKNKQHQLFLETLDQKLRNAKTLSYLNKQPITSDWFVGFFEAEGTLHFSIKATVPRFFAKVTQKNKPLLVKIQQWFGNGSVQKERQSIYYFGFSNKDQIKQIACFFEKNTFYSQKNLSRIKWLKAYRLVCQAKLKHVSVSEIQLQKLLKLSQSMN